MIYILPLFVCIRNFYYIEDDSLRSALRQFNVLVNLTSKFLFSTFVDLLLYFPQNFEPVPYPKSDYGKFYTGDSYIVLNVSTFEL